MLVALSAHRQTVREIVEFLVIGQLQPNFVDHWKKLIFFFQLFCIHFEGPIEIKTKGSLLWINIISSSVDGFHPLFADNNTTDKPNTRTHSCIIMINARTFLKIKNSV